MADVGRPSSYTTLLGAEIAMQVADGRVLSSICSDEGMPARSTVYEWLNAHKEFADTYAHAREVRADLWGEEILAIADDTSSDFHEGADDDGGRRLNAEHVQRSRLRIDSRKWLMAKAAPKRYGDKVVNEHGGLDGNPIETTQVPYTDLDRAKALAAMIAKTKAKASEG